MPYDPIRADPSAPVRPRPGLRGEPGTVRDPGHGDPDGGPRQAVVWYRLDTDGRITINSADGRRWPANLRRDPRCGLAIADPGDAYAFVALAGRVAEMIDDQAVAQADIADLARRYHPDDPAVVAEDVARFRAQHRVSFRVAIVTAYEHLDD